MNPVRPTFSSVPQISAQASPPPPDPRERIARMKSLARRAVGFWKGALALFVVGLGLTALLTMKVAYTYKSECIVLFRQGMATRDDDGPGDRAVRIAPRLREMLVTRARLEPIIKELGLYARVVESRGMVEAVSEMREHIGFRGRDSETFVISYDGDTPQIAQKVTQRLAETMMDDFAKSNTSATRQQVDFLGEELRRSEEELEKATSKITSFLVDHPEFAAEARSASAAMGGVPGIVPAAALSAAAASPTHGMDPQLAALWRQRQAIEAEARAASGQPPPAPPPPDEKLQALVKQRDDALQRLTEAQNDFADKKVKYTDKHPDYIASRSALDAANRTMQQAEAALSAARAAAAPPPYVPPPGLNPDLKRRLDAINGQIAFRQSQLRQASAKKPGAKEPAGPSLAEQELEWQRLLRAVRDARAVTEDLKTRYERAKLTASAVASVSGDKMEILDPAYPPTRPLKGGRRNAALAGLAITFLLTFGYAFGRVAFSDTLVDAGDVEALHMIPVLGVLPRLPAAPEESSKGGGPSGVV